MNLHFKIKNKIAFLCYNINLLFFCLPFYGTAQITPEEHNKYWYYRQRLLTEFMVPGHLGPDVDPCSTDPGGYHIPAEVVYAPNDKKIAFVDETIHIGYYIGVMATEYRLLKDAGWDTSQTEKELYYAMRAYERADARSSYLGIDRGSNCQINGYFIRGDIDKNIFDRNPVFEKYKIDGKYNYEAKTLERDLPDKSAKDIRNRTPDHVHALMFGFSLAHKCLDASANYNGFYFKEKASEFTDMIASTLNENEWFDINESGQDMGTERGTHKTFRREGHAFITAKAAHRINPHKDPEDDYLNSFTKFGISFRKNKLNALRAALLKGAEVEIIDIDIDVFISNFNLGLDIEIDTTRDFLISHMGAGIAASGSKHGWPFKPEKFLDNINENIYDLGLFKLAYKYIRDDFRHTTDDRWHNDLTSAPCYGPQHQPINMDSAHPYWKGKSPWRGRSKWIKSLQRNGHKEKGKFPGWDYMIFYNLYNLYYKKANPFYVSNIPKAVPGLNVNLNKPITLNEDIKSYNWIDMSSTIQVSKNRNISAAQKVTLKPGFSFKPSINKELRIIVNGPTNACGDRLDSFGELLNPDPSAAMGKSTASSIEKENITKPSFTKPRGNYKPLDQYLKERKNENTYHLSGKFKVYPNPIVSEINISTQLKEYQNIKVTLTNITGQMVYQKHIESITNSISLKIENNIMPGIYFLSITTENSTEVFKIFKN